MSSLCQTRSSVCRFFIYPTNQISKSKPGAWLWRWWKRLAWATTETAARMCERLTKEPITTNPSIAKDSWASCAYATLNCAVLLKYELFTGECSPPVGKCSPPDRNRSIFPFKPLSIWLKGRSLWVCLPSRPWFFFSETTITDRRWKLVSNARLPQ